jgi:hypothetical protein
MFLRERERKRGYKSTWSVRSQRAKRGRGGGTSRQLGISLGPSFAA